MLAASLREIAAGGYSKLRGKRLQKNGHEAGNHHGAEQRVAIPGAAPQVRRPVPWIHVTDGDQVAWPRKRNHFSEKGGARQDGNAAVGLRKRRRNCFRLKTGMRYGRSFFRISGA